MKCRIKQTAHQAQRGGPVLNDHVRELSFGDMAEKAYQPERNDRNETSTSKHSPPRFQKIHVYFRRSSGIRELDRDILTLHDRMNAKQIILTRWSAHVSPSKP